jgi:hypothetical protein
MVHQLSPSNRKLNADFMQPPCFAYFSVTKHGFKTLRVLRGSIVAPSSKVRASAMLLPTAGT